MHPNDHKGQIPHHIHQNIDQAAKVGQEEKPVSEYFPPQMNQIGNNFRYKFMSLEPGVSRAEVVACLDHWNEGDNGRVEEVATVIQQF